MMRAAHFIVPPGPVANGLRIGLLGGSFNPAHHGHIHVSDTALKRLHLDYVWWLVSPQNPLKPVHGMAPLEARLAAARASVHHPRILVTDIEQALGTRYTVDTIAALRSRFPQPHFVWLMGSDNLDGFSRWQSWAEIARKIPVAVVIRPGSSLAPLRARMAQRFARHRLAPGPGIVTAKPPAFTVLDGPRNPTSATQIRHMSARGGALERAPRA